MTTMKTLNRQAKAVQQTTRGYWVKFMGDYSSNAFEAIYIHHEDRMECSTLDHYQISVTKENGAWFAYAEEHDVDELVRSGYQPKEGFKTLKEAKAAAEAFGEHFEACWKECEGIED